MGAGVRPMTRRLALVAALVAVVALGLPGAPVARAAGTTFGTPSATATFGTSITFVQPVSLAGALRRAEILLTFEGTDEPLVEEVPLGSDSQPSTLQFVWSIAQNGPIVPNTRITAVWRITPAAGSSGVETGPSSSLLYADTRFSWQTMSGSIVRLHWYSGSRSFGDQALAVGEKGVSNAATLLGVTETSPIDFFVYSDQQVLCGVLGFPGSCNVAGQARPDIRTLFGAVPPGQLGSSEISRVIPHELTHIVFDTAVHNPYHSPPDWLNEGLAVYLSQGFDPSDRATVAQAVGSGDIIPLSAYAIAFPPEALYDRFVLAYAESVSAVDFMIRTYGKDALVRLIRSYASGVTDDEAFKAALGVDVAGFQAAWLTDLGASAPRQYGPQPGLPGPVPSGWSTAGAPIASAGASPPASSGSPVVQPTATSQAQASLAPADTGGSGGTGGGDAGLGLAILVVAGVVVGAVVALRMRRRAAPGPPTP